MSAVVVIFCPDPSHHINIHFNIHHFSRTKYQPILLFLTHCCLVLHKYYKNTRKMESVVI